MATLTAEELVQIRRDVARAGDIPINYTKATINTALQAIEDWYEANRATLGVSIDAAIAPQVLTLAQKREITKFWLTQKSGREDK